MNGDCHRSKNSFAVEPLYTQPLAQLSTQIPLCQVAGRVRNKATLMASSPHPSAQTQRPLPFTTESFHLDEFISDMRLFDMRLLEMVVAVIASLSA